MLEAALAYARAHQEAHLAELSDWLRIPSISTLPEYADEVRGAAAWAQTKLGAIGFEQVELIETARHPLVYAERLGVGAPTLLIYGHFDVQPVDPLEAWDCPPFEPRLERDNLYARGASDDKGQVYALLAALESCLKSSDELPVNVKILLEGEEEISSPSLFPYLRSHAAKLAADAILIADQQMLDPEHPLIMYGVRGSLYIEIEARGPAIDLHSGTFGGGVDNPFNVLARLLASLQDGETRRVRIPGFYDSVQDLDEEERALIASAPINDQLGSYLTGAPALAGEHGFSLAERISVRPTLDIHGIAGGFTGEGKKTVIPSRATAKLSMRLVPRQDPDEIFALLSQYLEQIKPPTVDLDVRMIGKARPVKIDYRAPAVQAAARAYKMAFGASPVYLRGGGSLPIVDEMITVLSRPDQERIPVVMIGFGLPDDQTHAPNEKLYLPNFYKGIETMIHYLHLFS
jgi:acetylornithine deacetylase/succinyl-diaminopimelate desuccinylase-like protein